MAIKVKMIYPTVQVANMLSGLMNKRAGEKRFTVEKVASGFEVRDLQAVVEVAENPLAIAPVLVGDVLTYVFDFSRQTDQWLYFKGAPIQWVHKGKLVGYDLIEEPWETTRVSIKVKKSVAKKLGLPI